MEVVSLKPLSRATLTAHLRPKFTRCYSKTPKPSHLPAISLDSSTGRFPAGPIASGASPFNPLCLILHSFGGFVFSRLPKAQSWLHAGLPDGCKRQRGGFLCCGGIGTFLMSTTSAASKDRVSPYLWTLAGNPTFMSGLVAWSLAQTIKMLLTFFFERRWDLGVLFSSGGMPSSHAALCTALTASVALCHGVGDSLFPVCLGFSLIVMYDAIGVRRHAGMQAEVLNKIIEDLFQAHPISKRKLKELLGHTPSQVFAGAVLGILVACVCCHSYILPILIQWKSTPNGQFLSALW